MGSAILSVRILLPGRSRSDFDPGRQFVPKTEDQVLDVVERAVRAVDARDVHASRVQARKGLLIASLRADCANETRSYDIAPSRFTIVKSVHELSGV
jgi:hypothetical protein